MESRREFIRKASFLASGAGLFGTLPQSIQRALAINPAQGSTFWDANECLEEGHIKTAFAAVMFRGAKPKNSRIIMGSSLREVAKKRPEFGLSWPWQGLTDLTRGIRRKETYYFGAGTKMGKSEVVNAIGDHLIRHHDLPVMFCKPEEDAAKTYKLLVGKAAGRIFHDPSIPFDEEAFDQAEKLIGDKAIIVDSYQFVDWDTLKGDK